MEVRRDWIAVNVGGEEGVSFDVICASSASSRLVSESVGSDAAGAETSKFSTSEVTNLVSAVEGSDTSCRLRSESSVCLSERFMTKKSYEHSRYLHELHPAHTHRFIHLPNFHPAYTYAACCPNLRSH